MVTPLSFQIFGFSASVAAGFLLGAIYDVLRIWRDFFHSQKRAVFFQDFFYMVFCAFFSFLLALPLGGGAVRIYLLAGEAVGWFVYYFTVGQVTAYLFRAISGFLYRCFFDPIGRLLKRVSGWFGKKVKIAANLLKKKGRDWKKRLKQRAGIVYNRRNGLRRSRQKRKVVQRNESTRKSKTKKKFSA
ncbi:spore cortex biosynthesis protein YabQ [Caproicibacter sp.]|uniref:spore cortex biosynthesis protein YabQ n=1 Tax=Caproicibacter sp. TaxID=2814884 RepID=UPI003989A010